jgi:prephenate dehydrogenase
MISTPHDPEPVPPPSPAALPTPASRDRPGPGGGELGGTVVVVGLGVLGASVARTLGRGDPGRAVVGVEPDPLVAARALEARVVSRVDPSGDAVLGDASVVVFAAPLAALPEFLAGPAAAIPAGALVTDVVGLNGPVLTRARRAGRAEQWISAAPVLVTPNTGFGASSAGLLDGVEVRLSAEPEAAPDVRARAEGFWRSVGADPVWMEAREHDTLAAWAVLLPQLVSNALAGALHAAGVPPHALSPQARAMVELAATRPDRWSELLEAAAPATGTGLTSVTRAMNVVADLLARRHVDRIVEFMDRTHGWAASAPPEDP